MSAADSLLVAVPAAAVLLLTVATRPRGVDAVAPLRLAVVRTAVLTGTYAVLVVELLGALHALTRPAIVAAWLLFLAAAATAAGLRWRQVTRLAQPAAAAPRPVAVGAAVPAGTGPEAPAPPADDNGAGRDHAPRWVGRTPAGLLSVAVDAWRTAGRGERLLAGTVGGLVLLQLLVALVAEPNNFDSQTYHLPKVEHWVAQGDLDFWATAIHRQVTIPPGAEYLLLHLRLLTGGDQLYNLVQWAAGVVCLLVAARITAQLGGGRRAQLITAFVLASTPMVVLQATSTQTDLVCAAWVACAATVVLDGLRRRTGWGTVLALGAATGLTAVTKTSGLIALGPLLVLWGMAQLRLALTDGRAPADATAVRGVRRSRPAGGVARTVGGSALILLVAALVVGPFLARVTAEFGHPLGPPRLRESIPMERHDPQSILVNALRIGHTAFDTPLAPLRRVGAEAIIDGADLIGVDPQDRAITFGREVFPEPAWYPDEDRVAFPIAGVLALIGAAVALVRPRRIDPGQAGQMRGYAAVVLATVLLHTAMIKWQPWGNRLLLYALVLAVPLAGLWLDALLRRHSGAAADRRGTGRGRRSVATVAAVTVLATSALAGVLALSYGFPRRLVGSGSVFTTSDWDTRFLRRPQWADEFRWAAAAVHDSGARRIGLVEQNDNWEYPWWLLLRQPDRRSPDLVALQSVLPERPPANPTSVDAIVCTGSQPACAKLVPAGWRLEFRGYVGYALPPGR
ncbi:Dolichyl-phosphate-mannose-protein mannosyltransferase [Micromonospora coriariae]|uniref:Dolichyl-phosphate-mannose-protein mannosyltransferase n=1 Tax=Micromonospora coriariae TaxID=285665 RepID=A0A1C4VVM7_9ACTN|nr:glycosyltransferase family 39 protein [Micromonospora coriariae]SCE88008.1 Dolichyl-phosphate-mannose-protein mannosyltransferase [Micromonospora coriariae]